MWKGWEAEICRRRVSHGPQQLFEIRDWGRFTILTRVERFINFLMDYPQAHLSPFLADLLEKLEKESFASDGTWLMLTDSFSLPVLFFFGWFFDFLILRVWFARSIRKGEFSTPKIRDSCYFCLTFPFVMISMKTFETYRIDWYDWEELLEFFQNFSSTPFFRNEVFCWGNVVLTLLKL